MNMQHAGTVILVISLLATLLFFLVHAWSRGRFCRTKRDRHVLPLVSVAHPSPPARAKLRSRAALLSLADHLPRDVVELVCREMWENPVNDFIAGQGWLQQRWTWTKTALILDVPPFRLPDVMAHASLPHIWEHSNHYTWRRTIEECSVEFCEALRELSHHPEWIVSSPETDTDINCNTMMCKYIQHYGDPVHYECTQRYVELGL